MRIIHLIGARCSGKTMIAKSMILPTWDVLEFYRKHRCLDSRQSLIWAMVDRARIKLIPDINAFINSQKGKTRTCIVESSGINLSLESYLSTCGIPVVVICLEPPAEDDLRQRCNRSKLNHAETVKYNDRWTGKALMMGKGPMLTQAHAMQRIKELA